MKGYDPSSQTVFLPRQFSFSSANHTPNGHVFSSRGPALRAASTEPSAVRPDGLRDMQSSFSQTTVDHPSAPVEGERPAVRGWQDKAVLPDGPPASSQPGPDTIVARSSVMDSGSVRSQNSSDAKERLVKGAVWMKPGVKSAMQRLAKQDGDSFSGACADALEVFARSKIHDQEEALFEPRMRKMMRREIRSSDDRHMPFEIRNAIASEQTRMIVTDLYKRLLAKEGLSQEQIAAKFRKAYKQARFNIFKKTPQLQSMLAEYWQTTEDQASGQAGNAPGGQDAHVHDGEAGTGKPEA